MQHIYVEEKTKMKDIPRIENASHAKDSRSCEIFQVGTCKRKELLALPGDEQLHQFACQSHLHPILQTQIVEKKNITMNLH